MKINTVIDRIKVGHHLSGNNKPKFIKGVFWHEKVVVVGLVEIHKYLFAPQIEEIIPHALRPDDSVRMGLRLSRKATLKGESDLFPALALCCDLFPFEILL